MNTIDWSAKFKRQTRLYFIIAILAAVIGTYYFYQYLEQKRIDSSFMPVLVAGKDFSKHEIIQISDIEVKEFQKDKIPANAITNIDEVKGKICIFDISKNQILVPQFFTFEIDPDSISIDLLEGYYAFPVGFDWFTAPVPAVKEGDFVDIIASSVYTHMEEGTEIADADAIIPIINVKVLRVESGESSSGSAHLILMTTEEESKALMTMRALKVHINLLIRSQ